MKTLFRVPFHDVDSLQIVWHGNYYKYFELARTDLYQSIDLDVDQLQKNRFILPIIHSDCRYSKPLRYNQEITISSEFVAYEYYIEIAYKITVSGSASLAASGHTRQACCDLNHNIIYPVPEYISTKISNA